MNEIVWITKKGVGANLKVGDRFEGRGIFSLYKNGRLIPSYGTIKAVERDFQENIDTGCPFYYVKMRLDYCSDTFITHTQPLKKLKEAVLI